jgi:hypothetical protein
VSETASPRRAGHLQGAAGAPAIISRMKIISLLHVVIAQAFYRWAMKEINPMHPDVPRIMLRQQQLAEKYRRIWA